MVSVRHLRDPLKRTATDTAYTYGWDGLTLRWMRGDSAGASSTIEYLSYGDGRAYAASYVATRGAETTSAVFQLLSSDHGDIVALADETGEVFARYSYGPYGENEGVTTRQTGRVSAELAAEIAKAQPLRYAGYCFDEWSGDYYLQARYYDAPTKQFISKDPAEADGEESAYQYCAGDPIHKVDPSGLWGWGALGKAFSAVKKSVVKAVSRAATVVRATAAKVNKRVVAAVKHTKTRIVEKAQQASSWAATQASRAKSRAAELAAAARKAAAARAAAAEKRAKATAKAKAAAKRASTRKPDRSTFGRGNLNWRVSEPDTTDAYAMAMGVAGDGASALAATATVAGAGTGGAFGTAVFPVAGTGVGAGVGALVAGASFQAAALNYNLAVDGSNVARTASLWVAGERTAGDVVHAVFGIAPGANTAQLAMHTWFTDIENRTGREIYAR